MKNKETWIVTGSKIFAVVFLLFQFPATASSAAKEARTVISPTLSSPEFVKPGGVLTATVKSIEKSTLFESGALVPSFGTSARIPLILKNEIAQPDGAINLILETAANSAPGLYDLCITLKAADKSTEDCADHAVSVIEGFKESFRFAVFSDYHVGDPRAIAQVRGLSLEALRAKGMKALNDEKPDFVLVTGDMVVYPTSYDTDFPKCYDEFKKGAEEPVFLAPGNHDEYSMLKGTKRPVDGNEYWIKTFGPQHQSFTYGKFKFIGINSFSWPIKYRDRFSGALLKKADSDSSGIMSIEELDWLASQIDEAKKAGLEPIIYAHHSPKDFSNYPGTDKISLINKDKMLAFLKEKGIRYYFFGHTHRNYVEKEGDLTLVSTSTVGSDLGDDSGWSFRIIDVDPAGDLKMKVVTFQEPAKK